MISPNESRAIARLAQTLTGADAIALMELQRKSKPIYDYPQAWQTFIHNWVNNQHLSSKAIKPELARPAAAGVPGPYDIKRALNRLAILPNPPEANMADIEKYVESPWALKPVPTIDPLNWDDAKVTVINIADLYATDEYLNRKKVRRHIKAMGQALTPNRSFALVAVVDGLATIIDGHHRLLSMWLLGLDQAPVWLIKE